MMQETIVNSVTANLQILTMTPTFKTYSCHINCLGSNKFCSHKLDPKQFPADHIAMAVHLSCSADHLSSVTCYWTPIMKYSHYLPPSELTCYIFISLNAPHFLVSSCIFMLTFCAILCWS